MIFTSHLFLDIFLPLFLLAYYLSPRRSRTLVLALASYLFYGWWRPDFVLLMLLSTSIDYTCGQRITAARRRGASGRIPLAFSIATNLGLLGYYKYANFAIETLNIVRGWTDQPTLPWAEIVLPVGISFYTFQSMSYTIDLYRGQTEPVQRFTDFMCFVAMFPQLVAGPIVRYKDFAHQLHSRRHSLSKFSRGVVAFQIGLVKKVMIADTLAPIADAAFGSGTPGCLEAWIGVLAYSFQIYFDFSGYSDMAIGLGLMIGFRLPINFNKPYSAAGISDFWRRWHISLSRFLRDYLYIPLGGNRKGTVRTYANLTITMLLGGLWHGPHWTFVAWGAYHGALLALERISKKRFSLAIPRPFQAATTFLLVLIGWVFFRSPSMSFAVSYFDAMADIVDLAANPWLPQLRLNGVVLLCAALVVWGLPTSRELVKRCEPGFLVFLQGAFVIALLHLHFQGHTPFLYFQF